LPNGFVDCLRRNFDEPLLCRLNLHASDYRNHLPLPRAFNEPVW
jgi:hypothetical protein